MPKISKNIKKIRTEKNLTQDALAEKLHVTRQAISNWENDKTKPDIESFEALATALEVEVEELIYGEKKEIIVSQDKTKEKNRIKIILAIVGSLFVASGLALVFFGFWQDFPLPLQTVFSFLPMLIGQGVAVFTFLKKKDSIPWREGAAIIWTVGIVATIALLNDIYKIDLGYINCLAIDSFLIIPVMFLLNAVSPLAFFLYSAIHTGVEGRWQYIVISMVIFIIGAVFTVLFSRKKEDSRGTFAQWITVIASIPLVWIYYLAGVEMGILLNSLEGFVLLYITYFLCMYILASENTPYSLPYKPVSLVGIFVATVYITTEKLGEGYAESELTSMLIGCAICLALPLIVAFIKRESFEDNIEKILISVFPFALSVISFGIIFMDEFRDGDNGVYLVLISALEILLRVVIAVFGIVLIYAGIKELRLFLVNLGLFTVFFRIINLLYSGIFEISYFSMGAVLVLFGATIIGINRKMLSIKKTIKEQAEEGSEND